MARPRLGIRVTTPDGEPFERQLAGPAAVLGRSAQADVTIDDPYLSRRHVRLFVSGDTWFVEELGSRNPTLLNEAPIAGRAPLRPGDVLRLGGTTVVVAAPAAPPSGLRAGPGLEQVAVITRPATPSAPVSESRLKLVNEVHRALARPISLEDLLALVLDRAFTNLAPEEAAIFLRDATGNLYRAASHRRPADDDAEAGEYLYSRRLVEEVADKGLAALVVDATVDERFAGSESMTVAGVQSLIAAPLLDDAGCLGMIVLVSRARVRSFSEADLELLMSLAAAAALRIRNLALAEEASLRQVMETELGLARDIQLGMLPRRFPDQPELEIHAMLRPAASVGGDLYDFVVKDRQLWFIVGDVAGKGMGAALFMAMTKTLFHAFVQLDAPLARVFEWMNRELASYSEPAMFVTAFAARLDLDTGALEFVNAGHFPPYRLPLDGAPQAVVGAPGVPLGVLEDFVYATDTTYLTPGDGLLLFTDGVVEALDPAGELFTGERLRAWLASARGASARELVHGTLSAVENFVGAAAQFDDITLLALRYRAQRREDAPTEDGRPPVSACVACDAPPAHPAESAEVRSNVRAFRDERFRVWRCPRCASLHRADDVDLAHYYAGYPLHQPKRDLIVQFIDDNLLNRLRRVGVRRDHRILDYGCGAGGLVEHLAARGYRHARGWDRYVPAHADPSVLAPGAYDCVICLDVLEHVDDPRALLGALGALARPGGLVVIVTPNAAAIDLARPEEFVHALHQPYHGHILSKQALLDGATAVGWSLVRFWRRHYSDTLIPGLNDRFYNFYGRLFDNTMDLFFDGLRFDWRLLGPRALFRFFFGYFTSPGMNMMAAFRTPPPSLDQRTAASRSLIASPQ